MVPPRSSSRSAGGRPWPLASVSAAGREVQLVFAVGLAQQANGMIVLGSLEAGSHDHFISKPWDLI